jgi:hypothetical protein
MNPEKLQALVLRTVGTTECFAFAAVVVPYHWMQAAHGWLGLGEMPDVTVLRYIIREASFVFGLHGILLWLLASDVERFRPLIVYTGFSYFLGGPCFRSDGSGSGHAVVLVRGRGTILFDCGYASLVATPEHEGKIRLCFLYKNDVNDILTGMRPV